MFLEKIVQIIRIVSDIKSTLSTLFWDQIDFSTPHRVLSWAVIPVTFMFLLVFKRLLFQFGWFFLLFMWFYTIYVPKYASFFFLNPNQRIIID